MSRRKKILAHINPSTQKGLEIGPLDQPTITRKEGDIRYVDHAPTEELRRKYQHDEKVNIDEIVNVDYVWGDKTLRAAVGVSETFDYVIAVHVIEHVPDIIGWLKEISDILKIGGILSLIIPDKRYMFDFKRPTSTTGDLIDAHFRKLRKPSPKQIFDSHYCSVALETRYAWSTDFDESKLTSIHDHPGGVLELCEKSFEDNQYIDSHCYVFTPESFLEVMKDLIDLNYSDFKIVEFHLTEANTNEFHVSLEKLPVMRDLESKRRIQLNSLASLEGLRSNYRSSGQKRSMRELIFWRISAPLRKIKVLLNKCRSFKK